MSFSDFAGGTQSSLSSSSSTAKTTTNKTTTNAVTTSFGSDFNISKTTTTTTSNNNKALIAISDALLQYQRNVGILEKIVQSLQQQGAVVVVSSSNSGSTNNNSRQQQQQQNWNETIIQYEAQNHVLQQLEIKLNSLLLSLQQPKAMNTTSHNNKNNSNNNSTTTTTTTTTYMKLQRDYERVQIRIQQLQDIATTQISLYQSQSRTTTTNNNNNNHGISPFFLNQNNNNNNNNSSAGNDAVLRQNQQQQQLVLEQQQQQEDQLQIEIMREREEEIYNINRGMHTVHEIYKDLAHIVSQQQSNIDIIEQQMDTAHSNAQQGLQQVEKANEKYGQSGNCYIM